MQTFEVSEVLQCLDLLLDLVVQREEILITREGKPIARLVSAKRHAAAAAAERTRARAKGVTLGQLSISEMIDDGRH